MIKVFKKPTTINITICDNKKVDGKRVTKTVSLIVPDKTEETIARLKEDVVSAIAPLHEDTKDKISLQFRLDGNTRAGQVHLNTTKHLGRNLKFLSFLLAFCLPISYIPQSIIFEKLN